MSIELHLILFTVVKWVDEINILIKKNLLFSWIKNSCWNNIGYDCFIMTNFLLVNATLFGNFPLIFVVIKNNWCILFLNLRCKSILVVIPEKVQKLFIIYFIGVEMNFNSFRMIASEYVEKNNFIINLKVSTYLEFYM